MRIFLTERSFNVVAVEDTGQMISGLTFFGKTGFANAAAIFPSRQFGTVIGMCAAMGHIIGFALACEEMLCVPAFRFVGLTQSFFGIAPGICCTCLADYPFI